MAHDPRIILVYNNFCRQMKRNDQGIGDANQQHNVTNWYLARFAVEILPVAVTKDMLHLEGKLNARSIVHSIGNDEWRKATTLSNIDRVLGFLVLEVAKRFKGFKFPTALWNGVDIRKGKAYARFLFPEIDVLPVRKTEIFVGPVSPFDESTIAGTYQLHNDILLNYLEIDAEKDFDTRRLLVYSNQMTTARSRSTQYESVESKRAYDKKDYMSFVLGLFYIELNLGNTL